MAQVLSLYDKQFLKNQNFRQKFNNFRRQVVQNGVKSIKMEWDLCSSPPWVPFYHNTMFQNPMHKPSCQKSRKTIITQKVFVTQSAHIVHCNWHTQKPICVDFQALSNTFSLFKLMFFSIICWGKLRKQPKISHFIDFDWENALKWLERHVCRVQGMPNPMLQVSSLCNTQLLKNQNFRQKFHILLILTGKNALKWLEWCIFRV